MDRTERTPMKKQAMILICMMLASSATLVAFAPTASAHVCFSGASCSGLNCPDDGKTHVHVGTSPPWVCGSVPLKFALMHEFYLA